MHALCHKYNCICLVLLRFAITEHEKNNGVFRQEKSPVKMTGLLVLGWEKLLLFAEIDFDVPVLDLHSAIYSKVLLHLEATVEELRLVADTLGQTLLLGHVEVLLDDRLVLGVYALVDDHLGAILRCEASQVCQTLLGDQDVEVMLSVVDVRSFRNHTGNAARVGLARTGRRRVHDLQVAIAQEVP